MFYLSLGVAVCQLNLSRVIEMECHVSFLKWLRYSSEERWVDANLKGVVPVYDFEIGVVFTWES